MMQFQLQEKINLKTKPLKSLGQLEEIATQIGVLQSTLSPHLSKPTILVFAADHGIASEGVSAYPSSVTYQMVNNFIQNGAAINVFCKENAIDLKIIDSGVNHEFKKYPNLTNAKVGMGTRSFLHDLAMTETELATCFEYGKQIVTAEYESGCNIIGFGEMGIGNTSSASMIMSYLYDLPLDKCTGRGTGLDDTKYQRKLEILKKAKVNHGTISDPMIVLQTFGGFEIAQIVSSILEAYKRKMSIMIDGFITGAAFLIAHRIEPRCIENSIFCHLSNEAGHALMLEKLGVEPILNLKLRLGEGTGCALAYPIIKNAIAFLNNMASFESAGVSNSDT